MTAKQGRPAAGDARDIRASALTGDDRAPADSHRVRSPLVSTPAARAAGRADDTEGVTREVVVDGWRRRDVLGRTLVRVHPEATDAAP